MAVIVYKVNKVYERIAEGYDISVADNGCLIVRDGMKRQLAAYRADRWLDAAVEGQPSVVEVGKQPTIEVRTG